MSHSTASAPSQSAPGRLATLAAVLPAPASIPATGFIRQAQLIPAIIPVSSATWWRWCKSGKAPKPHKLSQRVTAWRAEDIRKFLDSMAQAAV